MNGESAKKVLDWCAKRDVERTLAGELNRKAEDLRMAQVLVSPGGPGEDAGAITKAGEEYAEALERWRLFVIHGDVQRDS